MNKTSRLVKIIFKFSFLKSHTCFSRGKKALLFCGLPNILNIHYLWLEKIVLTIWHSVWVNVNCIFFYVVITLKVLFYKPELKLIIVGIFNFISFLDFFFLSFGYPVPKHCPEDWKFCSHIQLFSNTTPFGI